MSVVRTIVLIGAGGDYFHLSWANILHGGKGLVGSTPL